MCTTESFRYPTTFSNDSVVHMMESALQYHRDIFAWLRHNCGVRKVFVTMSQQHFAPRGIMRTRGMRNRRNAIVHRIFAGQPGWRLGMCNEQIYEPGTLVQNIPVFGLA